MDFFPLLFFFSSHPPRQLQPSALPHFKLLLVQAHTFKHRALHFKLLLDRDHVFPNGWLADGLAVRYPTSYETII